ncbi:MAG: hypothetical protein AAF570_09600, partial [Bacteroidota bacterium]
GGLNTFCNTFPLDTNDALPMRAQDGMGFVGFDAQSDAARIEGLEQSLGLPCGLNSGRYAVSFYIARPWASQNVRIKTWLSRRWNRRHRKISDFQLSAAQTTPGQWYHVYNTFDLDVFDNQDRDLKHFVISGVNGANSNNVHHTYLDNVRFWRPCDEALKCRTTHGQICPLVISSPPPGVFLELRNIENVDSIRIKLYGSFNAQLVWDTTYINPNGFQEFKISTKMLSDRFAEQAYTVDMLLSNACGRHREELTNVSAGASISTFPAWIDTTANWSWAPVPCCLDTLRISNFTFAGIRAYIVKDFIEVGAGVVAAAGSEVVLQGQNYVELTSGVEFDDSVSSVEIITAPCTGCRMAPEGNSYVEEGEIYQGVMPGDLDPKPQNPGADRLSIACRPVPLHAEGKVYFQTSESGNVVISIYSITSNKRMVLLDEWREEGRYSIPIRTDGLPNGIYFLSLVSQGATATAKVAVKN